MWGSEAYCKDDECGSETPACAQAHIVRPEQSKPTAGSAAPKTYGTPITDPAAAMTASTLPLTTGTGPGAIPVVISERA
jgi:hypothetical protein